MTDMDKSIYKICREQAGYTQERAAELLSCSVRQLARYEAGASPVPDDLAYVFTNPASGEVTLLRPEEILHYKAYSEDGIKGVSVLQRASMTLSTARAAQQYENSTWLSGGQPSGILTTDSDLGDSMEIVQPDGSKVTVDPKEQLRRSWEAVHRGPGNAFRIAVLDLGLKYQPISMTNSDAQFVESNEIRVAKAGKRRDR